MGLVHKIPHLIHPERRVPWKTQLIRYSYVETPSGVRIIDPDESSDDPSGSYMTVIIRLDTTEYGRFNAIDGDDIQTTRGALNLIDALDECERASLPNLIDDKPISTATVPMLYTGHWWSKQLDPKTVRLPIYRLISGGR